MIEKSFRLSNGFWHKFFPNSNKLFSPQNIPLEIWDIDKRIKESKWNPGVYGMENIAFSNSGDKFVICGGWITSKPNKTEFRIYDANTLDCIDEFSLMEKCTNPLFTNDDNSLIFGTWEGNLYSYCLGEKTLTAQFTLKKHMFNLTHHGRCNDKIYASVTKKSDEQNNYAYDFVLEYDIANKVGTPVHFVDDANTHKMGDKSPVWQIDGLALQNNKLAVMTMTYGGIENGNAFNNASVYLYDTETKKTTLIKENFKASGIFDNYGCITWNNNGSKLTFIGLDEVYVFDVENSCETAMPFERATSVEFSNCGTGLAVGSKKAKLLKIE